MKILVSGFKPFRGESLNPSELLATELALEFDNVQAIILPVEFSVCFEVFRRHLENENYDYVIMLGQAAGRRKICLEKVALNWVQTTGGDEAGVVPAIGPIYPDQALALMSEFPVDAICDILKLESHPVQISFSAGTFVCNDLYYRTLSNFKNIKSVFVHLPLVPQQLKPNDPRFALPLEEQKIILSKLINELRLVQ